MSSMLCVKSHSEQNSTGACLACGEFPVRPTTQGEIEGSVAAIGNS